MKKILPNKSLAGLICLSALFVSTKITLASNSSMPLFIENKGQVLDLSGQKRNDIQFTFNSAGAKLFISKTGIYYQFMDSKVENKMELHRIDMQLVGASVPGEIRKENKQEYYQNYYIAGNTAELVQSYSRIVYMNVYPGIDWVIYTKDNTLEYDFIVHPGADVKQIKIKYDYADKILLNEDGSFSVYSRLGMLTEGKPYTYMQGDEKIVKSKFSLHNNLLQFELEDYDRSQTIVIDPTLVWSRYMGGNLSETINKVTENMAFGSTFSTFGIASSGGFQTVIGGGSDAFYSYFDNSGTLVYSTYFGGMDTDEALSGLLVSDGILSKAVMVGQTNSTSGIAQAGLVAYANLDGSSDGFIAVFLANGTLLFSSYFGGNDADYISDVKQLGLANDYTKLLVSGVTSSSSGFANSNTHQGGDDAFISQLDLASANISVVKFAYFGGGGNEFSNTIAVHSKKLYYLSGNTESASGISTAGAYDSSLNGSDDDFIACFDTSLNVKWASYYGGTASEKTGSSKNGSFCALDTTGFIYLLGNSTSGGLATVGAHDMSVNGVEDFFLVKFDSLGNRIWASYFGGFLGDIATSIAISSNNLIVLGGYSNSPFMDINGIGFVGANHNNNDIDALVVEFTTNGSFIWSSPLGSSLGNETFNSIAFSNSNLIAGGTTNSAFGLAYNSASSYSGSGDALIARINDKAIVTNPVSNSSLCPGDSMLITYNAIGNFAPTTIYRAELYTNFSVTNPIILGTNTTGSGVIRGFIPINTSSSFSGNTLKVVTNLPSNPPIASTSQTLGAIGSLPNAHIYPLTSTSICEGTNVVLKSPSNTNIVFRQWQQYKNNNWINIAGANSIAYAADSSGSYRVITTSVTGCDSTSNTISVSVQPIPNATISAVSQLFCIGDKLILTANTGQGLSYQWYINSSLLSNRASDTLQVNVSGNYAVKVTNSAGCSTTSPMFIATGLIKPPAQIVALGNLQICNGQSTLLSANNSPGVSYQWYKNDTLIIGATLRTYSAVVTGNYFVKELNTNNCDSTSNIIHVDVYEYPSPTITNSSAPYTCLGSTVILRTQNQFNYTFEWFLNGTNISGAVDTFYTASASGNYLVEVTNYGVCKTISNSIEINPAPELAEICYATVDSLSQFNVIHFQKPTQGFMKKYVFLREVSGNTYAPVDSILADEAGTIIDSISNPNNQAWSYILQSVDSCDNRTTTPIANRHTCLFLQTNYNLAAGVTNLSWNDYEGLNPTGAYYVVLRANSAIAPFDSIGSVSFTSPTQFSDNNTNTYPNALYKIEMKWISTCTPSQRVLAGFNTSKSNIKNRNNTVSIQSIKSNFKNSIKLYPNPAQKFVDVEFGTKSSTGQLIVNDILGKIVLNKSLDNLKESNKLRLNLDNLSAGVYSLSVITSDKNSTLKLIIE